MDDRSLSETIELAKKNNQKAFNNLFEEFWGYLYNYQLKKLIFYTTPFINGDISLKFWTIFIC